MILPVPLDTKNYIFTMVPEDDTSLNSIQPIFVQLLGLKGTTARQILSENGATKAIQKLTINMKDVGSIICIEISINENKPFKIKSIRVETDDV